MLVKGPSLRAHQYGGRIVRVESAPHGLLVKVRMDDGASCTFGTFTQERDASYRSGTAYERVRFADFFHRHEVINSVTPPSERKPETSTFESGRYICLWRTRSRIGWILKHPPFFSSSRAAKIVGESNRGKHMKSIDAFSAINATVWRSPTIP
jgi:hypothetical protein